MQELQMYMEDCIMIRFLSVFVTTSVASFRGRVGGEKTSFLLPRGLGTRLLPLVITGTTMSLYIMLVLILYRIGD